MQQKTSYGSAKARLRQVFVAVGLFSAFVNILMLTGPMFMLQVYDRVLSSGSLQTLIGLFVIVVLLFAFLGFFDFLRTRILSRAAFRLDQDISHQVYGLWIKAGSGQIKILGRPLNDLAVVRGFLSSPAILGFFDLPWVPFYLLIIALVHPWLGILAIAGAVVVGVIAYVNQLTTKDPLARAMAMDATETSFVEQSHLQADTILPLGMGKSVEGFWAEMHRKGLAVGQVGNDRGEGFSTSSKAFRLLLQSAILAMGGYLAVMQEISAGMIVAASIITGRALAPIDQVIGQWKSVVRAREANRRLDQAFAKVPAAEAQEVDLPAPQGKVSVRNVTKYPLGSEHNADAKPILSNVSFELPAGSSVGIIGPSASGKTTLAKLLVGGWQPDQGSVRLDGASLTQWDQEKLGRYIGYLPQRLDLLSGSIRDNIARFDPDAKDEDVIAAAEKAFAHEMIVGLPDGYMTKVGYSELPLSGGQVQRIGLARALYGAPKLIVLDEPNSNLDTQGDEALGQAIKTISASGSTIIVIAHRPSAIAAVDNLILLQSGQIADFGPKDVVLKRMMQVASPVTQNEKAKVS